MDIIERIENRRDDTTPAVGAMLDDSIKEIEKLRTALSDLLKYLDDHDWGTIPECATADRARDALGQCAPTKEC